MTETMHIPLFPLGTVLFPGGPLPLRIFERRYLDMVRDCAKNDTAFGVISIREGQETGGTPAIYDVGTLAKIVDFHTLPDGLLGIQVVGGQRFEVVRNEVLDNDLLMADVALLPDDPQTELPDAYAYLADVTRSIIDQVSEVYAVIPEHYDDAVWIGNRLAEMLPLSIADRHALMVLSDPLERLTRVAAVITERSEE